MSILSIIFMTGLFSGLCFCCDGLCFCHDGLCSCYAGLCFCSAAAPGAKPRPSPFYPATARAFWAKPTSRASAGQSAAPQVDPHACTVTFAGRNHWFRQQALRLLTDFLCRCLRCSLIFLCPFSSFSFCVSSCLSFSFSSSLLWPRIHLLHCWKVLKEIQRTLCSFVRIGI